MISRNLAPLPAHDRTRRKKCYILCSRFRRWHEQMRKIRRFDALIRRKPRACRKRRYLGCKSNLPFWPVQNIERLDPQRIARQPQTGLRHIPQGKRILSRQGFEHAGGIGSAPNRICQHLQDKFCITLAFEHLSIMDCGLHLAPMSSYIAVKDQNKTTIRRDKRLVGNRIQISCGKTHASKGNFSARIGPYTITIRPAMGKALQHGVHSALIAGVCCALQCHTLIGCLNVIVGADCVRPFIVAIHRHRFCRSRKTNRRRALDKLPSRSVSISTTSSASVNVASLCDANQLFPERIFKRKTGPMAGNCHGSFTNGIFHRCLGSKLSL